MFTSRTYYFIRASTCKHSSTDLPLSAHSSQLNFSLFFSFLYLNRWTENCSELFNYKANGDPVVLNCPQRDTENDHPILRKEVVAAVQSSKKRISAGVDNIPAELVQAGGEDVITAHRSHDNLQPALSTTLITSPLQFILLQVKILSRQWPAVK